MTLRADLLAAIEAHLRARHPGADSLLRRAQELEGQLEQIRSGSEIDPQRYAELLQEYEMIYAILEPAERQALLDPEVQRKFDTFRGLLDLKMQELATPEERRALQRRGEIEEQILALPQGAADTTAAMPPRP